MADSQDRQAYLEDRVRSILLITTELALRGYTPDEIQKTMQRLSQYMAMTQGQTTSANV